MPNDKQPTIASEGDKKKEASYTIKLSTHAFDLDFQYQWHVSRRTSGSRIYSVRARGFAAGRYCLLSASSGKVTGETQELHHRRRLNNNGWPGEC